ncbi:MAG: hypothetical protein AAFU68_02900 [Pseudomonadota bacterium]
MDAVFHAWMTEVGKVHTPEYWITVIFCLIGILIIWFFLFRYVGSDELRCENFNLRAENAKLKEALTPSGATKADYIGEFTFLFEFSDEDGNPDDVRVCVPWDTVKEIMAAIRARATLESSGEGAA